MNELAKAKSFYINSHEMSKRIKDISIQSMCLYNLGELYFIQKFFDEALSFFEDSLKLKLEIYGEENKETAQVLDSLGFLYMKLENYEKAMELCMNSHMIYSKLTKIMTLEALVNVFHLSIIFVRLGKFKEGENYFTLGKSAINNFEKWVENEMCEFYETCEKLYEENGEFGKARKYHYKAKILKNINIKNKK